VALSAGNIVLRVVIFQERHDPNTWVAQALERDIAAYGPDIERAKRAFEDTVSGYIHLAEKHGQEPLATLKPAPKLFFDLWKSMARPQETAELIPSVDLYMLPVVSHDPLPA
jgi:hypothetical protein